MSDTLRKGHQIYIVSPNPATNTIIIAVNRAKPTVIKTASNSLKILPTVVTGFDAVTIYDLSGKVAKQLIFGQTIQTNIDVEDLPDGTYFVKIMNGKDEQTQKLVISRK
jgi:Secretion system C-terminal sorting domain